MIVCRAPLRISLGGGGTDIPAYYSRFGGFLVSGAINKYIYITAHRRTLTDEIKLNYSQTEMVDSLDGVKHNIFREALKLTEFTKAIEISSIADVGAGTGLGSSGTFSVALLAALHNLKKEALSREQLAEEACDIEINKLGYAVGKQDQYIASFGGIVSMEIAKDGNVKIENLKISEDALEEMQNNILLFFTGKTRIASEILQEQKKAEERNDEKVLEAMHEIKKMGYESKKVFESGNPDKFGELLDKHWEMKKQLSDKVASPKINDLYSIAIKNGAIGGKLVGAGGGGFLMFYVPGDKKRLREVMSKARLRELRFNFDFDGVKTMSNF